MAQSKSSGRWLKEHFSDPYVKKAQLEGYRARSAYKLLELQERDAFVKAGMIVVDLGAAPGGWSQLLTQWVGKSGQVWALDILPMQALPGVTCLQGDFQEDEVLQTLLQSLGSVHPDVVVSDMAPNTSGMNAVDQPRAMYLAELALDFAQKVLKPGGTFVTKLFQGTGSEGYIKQLRLLFQTVHIRKPQASRSRSREVYLVAKGYKEHH